MKRFGKLLGCAGVMLLWGAQTLWAVDSAWFGRWKLDRAQSHFTGPTITIVRIPLGYHFDFGATSFDIGDDGRDYPTVARRSTSMKAVSDHEWLRVHKVDGKEVDHSTLRITPDEKRLLIHTVAVGPDGATHVSDDTEVRVGEGTGLQGTWRSAVAGINVSEVIQLGDAGGGKIRWDFPKDGQFYVIAPNGAAAGYGGARAVPGVTVVLRAESARKMRWEESIDGKPYTDGEDVLSADGRRLTETTWPVKRPAEKQESVYVRE